MAIGTLGVLLPLAAANPPLPPAAGCPAPAMPGPAFPVPPPGKPGPCAPIGPPAAVLVVKVVPPPGVRVTVAPGGDARMLPPGAVFGLRPGYAYRLALSEIPGRPNATLYPEIEVRGSLVPRNGMNPAEYPAAISLTESDIEKAAGGLLVTKVIYLEDPDRATPVRTTVDRPHEELMPSAGEAVNAAIESGRPVMVVRIGNRVPDAEALRRAAVPGTVQYPGEILAPAAAPPTLGWYGVPLFDPILGPKIPTEECAPDGGDTGRRLGIGPDGKTAGFDPTDVAVEYSKGAKRAVATSNRVCVCAPRFAAFRAEAGAGGVSLVTNLMSGTQAVGPKALHDRIVANALLNRFKPVGLEARLRPAQQVGAVGVHVFNAALLKPQAVANSGSVKVAATYLGPDELTNLPNELLVTKSLDPAENVKVGDEVTVTIKYTNRTGGPVNDLVVSDNLGPRFEYVPGSAESDRPSNPTTEANPAGSVIVRFEIPGALPAGQDGVVKFKVRVR